MGARRTAQYFVGLLARWGPRDLPDPQDPRVLLARSAVRGTKESQVLLGRRCRAPKVPRVRQVLPRLVLQAPQAPQAPQVPRALAFKVPQVLKALLVRLAPVDQSVLLRSRTRRTATGWACS